MNGLERQYSDRIEFVALNFDDKSLNAVRSKYNITDRSQYVLLDANDQIVHRWYGFLNAADVKKVLDDFLAGG